MEWCKLYARLPRDVKILDAGEAAAWLFVVGLCHCAEQESDGFIAESALKTFGLRRVSARVRALVTTGLWQETDGGWLVTNWAALQPTSAKLQVKREKTRQRVANHRARNAVTNADVTPTEEEIEVEEKREEHSSLFDVSPDPPAGRPSPPRAADRDDPQFAEFWEAYPRKVGKGAARKAWKTATKKTDGAALVAAACRYRDDPTRSREEKYIPHPTTWLNGERWADQPATPPAGRPQLRAVGDGYQPWTNYPDQSVYDEDM